MITVNAFFSRRHKHPSRIESRNVTGIVLDREWDDPDDAGHIKLREVIRHYAPGPEWVLGGYALAGSDLTKAQALQMMNAGCKVRHRHFCPEEWVRLTGRLYEFEDGVVVTPEDFWKWRGHPSWETGWEVV